MSYDEYIRYHRQGDAGVEERTIARLGKELELSSWDRFRLVYYYSMTYNIPSALDMLLMNVTDMAKLQFRTDRRYVRCNGAFARMLSELSNAKEKALMQVSSSQEAYNEVTRWFFFGRYAAFLFLEAYWNVFSPKWTDNVRFGWESNENYTRGAILITGSNDRKVLDQFLSTAKNDTEDNAFAIETSLCAAYTMFKGTRWNGYYTERMMNEAENSRYKELIYRVL